jgi:hypothetical protein
MNPVKYCLIAFYLSLSSSVFAQSFIAENKLWRYSSQVSGDGTHFYYNNIGFRFHGDSVIKDTTYYKLYSSEDEFLLKWKLYGLWRETKDMKIFSRHLYWQTEELLYDFSFVKGDTLNVGFATFQVDSVLTKLWGGKMRKHWYLYPVHAEGDTIKEWNKTLWVEDLGQIDYFPSSVGNLIGALNILLCFEENSQQVYQNPKYNTCFYTSINDEPNPDKGFKVFPNPVSGELFIQPTSNIDEDFTLEMYSVKGELVRKECLEPGSRLHRIDTSSLRNGIYILRLISDSGKYDEKVIVKE